MCSRMVSSPVCTKSIIYHLSPGLYQE
jgi:hypothetical protein